MTWIAEKYLLQYLFKNLKIFSAKSNDLLLTSGQKEFVWVYSRNSNLPRPRSRFYLAETNLEI